MQKHDENLEADRMDTMRSVSPVQAGLKSVCPICGEGKLFTGLLTLTEDCNHCHYDLKAADPGDGPSVFVIFILGPLVTIGALILEFKIGVAPWVHFAVWPVVTLAGAIWLLRVLKGWIVAMQFQKDAHEGFLDNSGADKEENTDV